jgi:hypothetical protein
MVTKTQQILRGGDANGEDNADLAPLNLSAGLESVIEEEEEPENQHEVDFIMAQRHGWDEDTKKNVDYFQVRWKNYDEESATWEKKYAFLGAPDTLLLWHEQKKNPTKEVAKRQSDKAVAESGRVSELLERRSSARLEELAAAAEERGREEAPSIGMLAMSPLACWP